MDTRELISRLKARYGLKSEYAVAKKLGVTPTTVYRYRDTDNEFDDEIALRAAELLELDPGRVLLELHARRTKCPAARKVLEGLAEKVGVVLIAAVVGLSGVAAGGAGAPFDPGTIADNAYYPPVMAAAWRGGGIPALLDFWAFLTLSGFLSALVINISRALFHRLRSMVGPFLPVESR